MIVPDYTLFIQMIIFLVALFFLNKFLFKPMIRVLEERKAKTTGREVEARRLEEESIEKERLYLEGMRKARNDMAEVRLQLRAEGLKIQREKLDQARTEANGYLASFREELQKERSAARAELVEQAEALSRVAVSRILGREIQ